MIPVNFDTKNLKDVEFNPRINCSIAEYELREDKRYVKRKRLVYNFNFFQWYLVSKLKDIYKEVEIPKEILMNMCLGVFPYRRNIMFYLI